VEAHEALVLPHAAGRRRGCWCERAGGRPGLPAPAPRAARRAVRSFASRRVSRALAKSTSRPPQARGFPTCGSRSEQQPKSPLRRRGFTPPSVSAAASTAPSAAPARPLTAARFRAFRVP
jgi:hypothetical protein